MTFDDINRKFAESKVEDRSQPQPDLNSPRRDRLHRPNQELLERKSIPAEKELCINCGIEYDFAFQCPNCEGIAKENSKTPITDNMPLLESQWKVVKQVKNRSRSRLIRDYKRGNYVNQFLNCETVDEKRMRCYHRWTNEYSRKDGLPLTEEDFCVLQDDFCIVEQSNSMTVRVRYEVDTTD